MQNETTTTAILPDRGDSVQRSQSNISQDARLTINVSSPSPIMIPLAPLLRILLLFIALLATRALAQSGPIGWTAVPFNPPALPLAVRSPYLNSWLAQGSNSGALNNLWSNLWTIGAVCVFSCFGYECWKGGGGYRICGTAALRIGITFTRNLFSMTDEVIFHAI